MIEQVDLRSYELCLGFPAVCRWPVFGMNYPNKLRTLQDLLEENGYSEWYALLPTKGSSTSDLKCTFVNFKERRKAAIEIPRAWFQDPAHYKPIVALVCFAIDDCSVSAVELTRQFFFLDQTAGNITPPIFPPRPH
jgi:hypothetical protein